MQIKKIVLYSNEIEKQFHFYKNTLGFDVIRVSRDLISFKAGNTIINFEKSEIDHKYHYCFLIPSNKLNEAKIWLEQRVALIKIEGERVIEQHTYWNAEAVYFYDGTGNVVEFIVHHDLDNKIKEAFDVSKIISINEIGVPSEDIPATNRILEKKLNSLFWKGNYTHFGTNGNQEGLFLLVNYTLKKTWFPTAVKIEQSPFNASISINNKLFNVIYKNGKIII